MNPVAGLLLLICLVILGIIIIDGAIHYFRQVMKEWRGK